MSTIILLFIIYFPYAHDTVAYVILFFHTKFLQHTLSLENTQTVTKNIPFLDGQEKYIFGNFWCVCVSQASVLGPISFTYTDQKKQYHPQTSGFCLNVNGYNHHSLACSPVFISSSCDWLGCNHNIRLETLTVLT